MVSSVLRNIKIDNIIGKENPIEKTFIDILDSCVLKKTKANDFWYQDQYVIFARSSTLNRFWIDSSIVSKFNTKLQKGELEEILKYLIQKHFEVSDDIIISITKIQQI